MLRNFIVDKHHLLIIALLCFRHFPEVYHMTSNYTTSPSSLTAIAPALMRLEGRRNHAAIPPDYHMI